MPKHRGYLDRRWDETRRQADARQAMLNELRLTEEVKRIGYSWMNEAMSLLDPVIDKQASSLVKDPPKDWHPSNDHNHAQICIAEAVRKTNASTVFYFLKLICGGDNDQVILASPRQKTNAAMIILHACAWRDASQKADAP